MKTRSRRVKCACFRGQEFNLWVVGGTVFSWRCVLLAPKCSKLKIKHRRRFVEHGTVNKSCKGKVLLYTTLTRPGWGQFLDSSFHSSLASRKAPIHSTKYALFMQRRKLPMYRQGLTTSSISSTMACLWCLVCFRWMFVMMSLSQKEQY